MTLTSNGFDFSLQTSLNDFGVATPAITFSETDVQNGGRFVEIIGAPNVVIIKERLIHLQLEQQDQFVTQMKLWVV